MSTFPSLTDDELCIINYSNIENLDFVCSCCGAHSQAIVSVLVPQKPIGGTLEMRMYQRILTKIGGDRETVGMSKDQPASAKFFIILEDILDSVQPPNLK